MRSAVSATITSGKSDLRPENYRFLQEYIYQESGIRIEAEKQYLLDMRLATLAREHGMNSLNDLCVVLRTAPAERLKRRVVEAMITNETSFFRDSAQCEALQEVVLPALIEARKETRTLRFWSAGTSTGQEAYTLAMILLEMNLGDWNIEILATDFSAQVLDKARSGRYLQIEVNRGLPALLLLKYFRRQGIEWKIKEEIRRMVRFEQFDLRQSMDAMGPFDIVFCRNAMDYFDAPVKTRITEGIHGTLFRGGYLMLGPDENGFEVTKKMVRRTIGAATLYEAT